MTINLSLFFSSKKAYRIDAAFWANIVESLQNPFGFCVYVDCCYSSHRLHLSLETAWNWFQWCSLTCFDRLVRENWPWRYEIMPCHNCKWAFEMQRQYVEIPSITSGSIASNFHLNWPLFGALIKFGIFYVQQQSKPFNSILLEQCNACSIETSCECIEKSISIAMGAATDKKNVRLAFSSE